MFVFVPMQCSFHYYSSVINLEVRNGSPSNTAILFLLHRIVLVFWNFLCFHIDFRIFFPVSKTNVLGMLIWIALNQKPSFGGMLIFTILILAIHGNWCLSIF